MKAYTIFPSFSKLRRTL